MEDLVVDKCIPIASQERPSDIFLTHGPSTWPNIVIRSSPELQSLSNSLLPSLSETGISIPSKI